MSSQTRPPVKTNRMTLENLRPARRESPDRILLYGTAGVGKTTWAACAPSPIFLPTERGIDDLGPEYEHVRAFPQPETFDEVLAAIRSLHGQTEFKTFVVDTVDWLEPLIWKHLCAKNGWDSIETPGFQRGQIAASEVWRTLTLELERMQDATGMGVILLGHSAMKTIQNPSGADFAMHTLKMDKYGTAVVREWTKANFFATEETYIAKTKGERSSKITGIGSRVMHTQAGPGWDAKNRWNLPPLLPLDYGEYLAARAKGQVAPTETLVAEAKTLIESLKDEPTKQKASAAVTKAGENATALAKIVDLLRTKVAEQENA